MGLPWKAFAVSSSGVALLFALRGTGLSASLAARIFAQVYLVQFAGWAVYRVLIWPHFLSPLIGLPEPSGSHWLMGQFQRIAKEPTGIPMRDW